MKNGDCPKCGGGKVFADTDNPYHHLPVSPSRLAELENYVCAECGYVESYVVQDRDLQTIRDYWARVRSVVKRPNRGNLPVPATPPEMSTNDLPLPVEDPAKEEC